MKTKSTPKWLDRKYSMLFQNIYVRMQMCSTHTREFEKDRLPESVFN